MAISTLESRRRLLKALLKDSNINPEVSELPVLPIKSDRIVSSEFPPTAQKFKALLKAGKMRHGK